MADPTGYPTPAAVESAIRDAARSAARADPSLNTSQRIRLAHFDRFLCRVFRDGAASAWLLKGGTSMLARVPSSRATLDIDLSRRGSSIDDALDELVSLSQVDLGDHCAFVFRGAREITAGATGPGTQGYRVTFDVLLGVKSVGVIGIDLVVGSVVTSTVTTLAPATRLHLPRLLSNPYRLYPVVDQIADNCVSPSPPKRTVAPCRPSIPSQSLQVGERGTRDSARRCHGVPIIGPSSSPVI